MIKILLVDDDAFYRTSFIALVDWAEIGCEVAYQAADGRQAIAILEKHQVDMVITDMSMPIVNGVELIIHVKNHWPGIACLALSGYDDFLFVKQSMQNGAADYILKHTVTEQSLLETMSAILPKIQKKGETVPAGRTEARTLSILLLEMLQSSVDEYSAYIKDFIENSPDRLPPPPFIFLAIKLKNRAELQGRYSSSDGFTQLLSMASDIVKNVMQKWGEVYTFVSEDGFIYLMLSNPALNSKLFEISTVHNAKTQISDSMERFLNCSVSVGASGVGSNWTKLQQCFNQALYNIDNISGNDTLKESFFKPALATLDIETEHRLSAALNGTDFNPISEVIGKQYEALRETEASRQSVQHLSVEFINILSRECRSRGIDVTQLYSNTESPYSEIASMQSYSALLEFIQDKYQAFHILLQEPAANENGLVSQALRYIHQNYSDSTLSQATVAEAVGCNPAYLSRLFKEKHDLGFAQYLAEYRIERSKELLANGHKVKDVAFMVGFENQNYFSTVFKKIVGASPQGFIGL